MAKFGLALCCIALEQFFLIGSPVFKILSDRCYVREIDYKRFVIDCSFRAYSMGPKFDQLIQCFAILILHYAARGHTFSFTYRQICNETRGRKYCDTVSLNEIDIFSKHAGKISSLWFILI
jgi:hypothetical protein